jgi:hypothetical protein
MCHKECTELRDACDECIERFYQRWKASNHRYAAKLRRQAKGRSPEMMRLITSTSSTTIPSTKDQMP